jgi:hypothetical protein
MFAAVISQRGKIWKAAVFYENKHGETVVSFSWHRTRAEAVAELLGFFG